MKFKHFWNSSGVANEEEINTWLTQFPDIKIHYMSGHADQVYILYDESNIEKIEKYVSSLIKEKEEVLPEVDPNKIRKLTEGINK